MSGRIEKKSMKKIESLERKNILIKHSEEIEWKEYLK